MLAELFGVSGRNLDQLCNVSSPMDGEQHEYPEQQSMPELS
jgi:hypothetical protein